MGGATGEASSSTYRTEGAMLTLRRLLPAEPSLRRLRPGRSCNPTTAGDIGDSGAARTDREPRETIAPGARINGSEGAPLMDPALSSAAAVAAAGLNGSGGAARSQMTDPAASSALNSRFTSCNMGTACSTKATGRDHEDRPHAHRHVQSRL